MGNDNIELARLWNLLASVNRLVQEGRRTPAEVSDVLQTIMEKQAEKFALLCDLGIITVPKGYIHKKVLLKFKKANQEKFFYYNDNITDANFSNPTRILKAGDQLQVRAYVQVSAGTTSSSERMEFLRAKQSVPVGAQGVALVFAQKRDLLPKGKWYASMDEETRLWKDAVGSARCLGCMRTLLVISISTSATSGIPGMPTAPCSLSVTCSLALRLSKKSLPLCYFELHFKVGSIFYIDVILYVGIK